MYSIFTYARSAYCIPSAEVGVVWLSFLFNESVIMLIEAIRLWLCCWSCFGICRYNRTRIFDFVVRSTRSCSSVSHRQLDSGQPNFPNPVPTSTLFPLWDLPVFSPLPWFPRTLPRWVVIERFHARPPIQSVREPMGGSWSKQIPSPLGTFDLGRQSGTRGCRMVFPEIPPPCR